MFDNDIERKELSVYESLQPKQAKLIQQISEEQPENETSSPDSLSKQFQKRQQYHEFQRNLTPLKKESQKEFKFDKIDMQNQDDLTVQDRESI